MDFLRYRDDAFSNPWFTLNPGPNRGQRFSDSWGLPDVFRPSRQPNRWRKYWYPTENVSSGDEEECRCLDCLRSKRRGNSKVTRNRNSKENGVKDRPVAIQHVHPTPTSTPTKAQTEEEKQETLRNEKNCSESRDVASPAPAINGEMMALPRPVAIGNKDDTITVAMEETATESNQESNVTESTKNTTAQDGDGSIVWEDVQAAQSSTETLRNEDGIQHEVSSENMQDSEQMDAEEEMETEKIPSDEGSEVFAKLMQIMSVVGNVGKHNATVLSFSGTKEDKEYIMVEDSLTKALLALDSIESGTHNEVRLARKAAVKYVQQILDKLEQCDNSTCSS